MLKDIWLHTEIPGKLELVPTGIHDGGKTIGMWVDAPREEKMEMTILDNIIAFPKPTEELISEKEKKWRLRFPEDYKQFIMEYNGGIPQEKTFLCDNCEYVIIRFLCIIKNIKETNAGWYDMGVVESQIGERLTNNEDLLGLKYYQ